MRTRHTRRRTISVVGLAAFLACAPAWAQQPESVPSEDIDLAGTTRIESDRDNNFGPPIVIEAIEVVGNTTTAQRIIIRALPFAVGDAMHAGDARLRAARVKVLALGFFRSVEPIRLRRGSKRGRVIATVEVSERGTVILNRMWFGRSQQTPWWVGLDATERNLLGTGLAVGGGFVIAEKGQAQGSRTQRALELRVADSSILGSQIGIFGSLHRVRASEPYRVSGAPSDARPTGFRAFDYSRLGGRLGLGVALSPLSRLTIGTRYEHVDTDLPELPTRDFPDGSVSAIDLFLGSGISSIVTASVGFDRDTRSDPVLSYDGHRVQLHGELGTGLLGSSYDFGVLLAKYERWWSLRSPQHVVSLHLTAGLLTGHAPRFDRFHAGDLNRLVTPRVLGLVVSTYPARDVFNTGANEVTYGTVGGVAEVQYAYRLFRRSRFIYGGDLFVGLGLWGLTSAEVRSQPATKAFPLDILVDVGLRLDTEVGIFELSFANGLGRIPF